MSTIVTDPKDLIAGKWYACGFGTLENEKKIDWNSAPIYQYLGEGMWVDEDGEVESLYDPVLQMRVAMDAAEAYAQQN